MEIFVSVKSNENENILSTTKGQRIQILEVLSCNIMLLPIITLPKIITLAPISASFLELHMFPASTLFLKQTHCF